MKDDLGYEVSDAPVKRVVSLVPSITETVAQIAPELLVGATDYCVHPPDRDVYRVGGSKYPRMDKILQCRPDMVLANAEENRKEDVEALREAGIRCWVCFPRTTVQACDSAARMIEALSLHQPDWIETAKTLWSAPTVTERRAVIPIWRKPWMVLGPDTFAGDVLRRLGVVNVFDDAAQPYPKVTLEQIRHKAPELVILPDEPYRFTDDDGPGFFPQTQCALVSGRHLTWHGPSLLEAYDLLRRQLRID